MDSVKSGYNPIDVVTDAEGSSYYQRIQAHSTFHKMSNTILSDKSRFQNKADLEIYAKDVLGQEKLTTFIVPDI